MKKKLIRCVFTYRPQLEKPIEVCDVYTPPGEQASRRKPRVARNQPRKQRNASDNLEQVWQYTYDSKRRIVSEDRLVLVPESELATLRTASAKRARSSSVACRPRSKKPTPAPKRKPARSRVK